MNLYAEQASNVRRTWVMMIGFLVVVAAVGYAVAWYFQDTLILWIARWFGLIGGPVPVG